MASKVAAALAHFPLETKAPQQQKRLPPWGRWLPARVNIGPFYEVKLRFHDPRADG